MTERVPQRPQQPAVKTGVTVVIKDELTMKAVWQVWPMRDIFNGHSCQYKCDCETCCMPKDNLWIPSSLKDPNTSTSLADGILFLFVVREKAGPLTVKQEVWLSQVDLDATLGLESVCDVLFVK